MTDELRRLTDVLEATSDGWWDWNVATGEVQRSPSLAQLLGPDASARRAHVTTWEDAIHPADREEVRNLLAAHLEGRTPTFETRYRMRTASGHYVWVRGRGRVLDRDADGRALRMVGTITDVSGRVSEEDVQRERLGIKQRALAGAAAAVAVTNASGHVLYVNPELTSLLGYTADDASRLPGAASLIAPDDVAGLARRLAAFAGSRLDGFDVLRRLAHSEFGAADLVHAVRRDGTRTPVRLQVRPVAGGGFVLTFLAAEPDAAVTPEGFRDGLERLADGAALLDAAGETRYLNRALALALRHAPAEIEHHAFWDFVHPDNRGAVRAAFDAALSGGGPQNVLLRLRRRDGSHGWFEGRVANLLGDPAAGGLVFVLRDISERMRVSAEYAREAERFRLGAKYTGVGVWDWNIVTGELWWSERIGWLFGYGADVPETTYENFLKSVHPDDRDLVTSAVNRAVNERAPYDLQHRVVWPDGTVRWVSERGAVMYGNDGTPVRMLGVVQDVTDLREATDEIIATRDRLLDRETRLRSIFDSVTDAILTLDRAGTVVAANAAAERMFGFESGRMLGADARALGAPADLPRLDPARVAAHLAELGRPLRRRVTARRNDGTTFPAEVLVSVLKIQGETFYTTIVQDLTERLTAESLQLRLIGILEASPDLVCLTGADGRAVYVNPAGRRLLGLGADAMPPSLLAMHLPAERERIEKTALPRALHAGEWTGESALVDAAGQEIPVIESIVVHRDLNGGETFVATICRDVREAKKVQRIKDELISTVNHELRTPLTSIRGTLGLLTGGAAGALDDETRQLLEVAQRNTQRLARLIDDFLDVAKMEAGERLVVPAEADLGALAEQAVAMMQGYAAQFGVTFRLTRPAAAVPALVDPERLLQVLANLLSNAVKFSPRGSAVEVEVRPLGRWVRVAVADRGPGIPREFRSKVFQKFAQADASDQRSRQGSGLGLSISKGLVVSMGGCIAFDDRPGGGTVFEVDVPGAQAHTGAAEKPLAY